MVQSTSASKIQEENLPPGYVLEQAADGTFFAVPQFLVPATHVAFDAYQKKKQFSMMTALR
jgi:hypothetical protein